MNWYINLYVYVIRAPYILKKKMFKKFCVKAVADPGFPPGGGVNPPGGAGAWTNKFAKFSQKLHEFERI